MQTLRCKPSVYCVSLVQAYCSAKPPKQAHCANAKPLTKPCVTGASMSRASHHVRTLGHSLLWASMRCFMAGASNKPNQPSRSRQKPLSNNKAALAHWLKEVRCTTGASSRGLASETPSWEWPPKSQRRKTTGNAHRTSRHNSLYTAYMHASSIQGTAGAWGLASND